MQGFRVNMNLHWNKTITRWIVLIVSASIIIGILIFTNLLVIKFKQEERQKVEIWARATKELTKKSESDIDIEFPYYIIESNRRNKAIPLILTSKENKILSYQNLDSIKSLDIYYLEGKRKEFAASNQPVQLNFSDENYGLIYYGESYFIRILRWFPVIILLVASLFVLIGYYTMIGFNKSEQNLLWAAIAKESAHQIGTPLSSLLGWAEILKLSENTRETGLEIEKDVMRLEAIANRFSKIGSSPEMEQTNIVESTQNVFNYMKSRSSKKIEYKFINERKEIFTMLNEQLYSWVIENLIKNGIDAMSGKGKISLELIEEMEKVILLVTDSGKGISKNAVSQLFKPGFTTKKRGWGLGLSLAKRIIENYHKGKVFVKRSELNKGSTFCVILPKKR